MVCKAAADEPSLEEAEDPARDPDGLRGQRPTIRDLEADALPGEGSVASA
jgi:hypothetical protein